eukprot:c22116_g1_i1.p1 GENE.c22116_g1_i1~~c22116_g1_i1.p1  ORF type:complete len:152 (-),score=18.64 c22116_g1_i1:75-530(-)
MTSGQIEMNTHTATKTRCNPDDPIDWKYRNFADISQDDQERASALDNKLTLNPTPPTKTARSTIDTAESRRTSTIDVSIGLISVGASSSRRLSDFAVSAPHKQTEIDAQPTVHCCFPCNPQTACVQCLVWGIVVVIIFLSRHAIKNWLDYV